VNIVAHYNRKLGAPGAGIYRCGYWDEDSGITHAEKDGRTLCGHFVRDFARGWDDLGPAHAGLPLDHSRNGVDCTACLRAARCARRVEQRGDS